MIYIVKERLELEALSWKLEEKTFSQAPSLKLRQDGFDVVQVGLFLQASNVKLEWWSQAGSNR